MKICPKCGYQCEDGADFCTVCGAQLITASAQPQQQQPQQQGEATQGQSTQDKVVDAFTNTTDTTADYSQEDISSNKVFAVLAYFGILCLVPIFAAKDSKYAAFHANQGLVLFIFEIICAVLCAIPVVGWIVGIIGELGGLVLAILGIVNAAQGKAKELPVIGKYKIINK